MQNNKDDFKIELSNKTMNERLLFKAEEMFETLKENY